MKRRDLLGGTAAGVALASAAAAQTPVTNSSEKTDIVFEAEQSGQPHKGKVLAAIQPHSDDIPILFGGTVAKLTKEGYKGVLIRTSNSEMDGSGPTRGATILGNERDNAEVAGVLGCEKVFNLFYRNHRMDNISPVELRARLIFIFRLMKVDTVITYDPSGHYEENPDHYVTARAVEAACWMAGGRWDYPEHFEAGIEPHLVSERYYYARGPQLVNRVVDVSSVIDDVVRANLANKTQGPASGNPGAKLRRELAAKGLKLPLLGNTDESADIAYVKNVVLSRSKALGAEHGVEFAEKFHYISPEQSHYNLRTRALVERLVDEQAERL